MESMLDEANAASKGEFVRDAIRFYIAFLHQRKSIDFISPLLAQTIKSEVESVEKNMCEMMFKVAVELSTLNNFVASDLDYSSETVKSVRTECAKAVSTLNGIIDFEHAYNLYHGENYGEDYSDEPVY